ncbi:hypothetical protein GCM10028825_44200 [Spirosoma agri]
MTRSYRDQKLAVGLSANDYVRSEYFGINQINELLNKEGCVGLRIHHAKRWEDAEGNPTKEGTGQLKPRVLLTAVDARGQDIVTKQDNRSLKDMSVNRGDDTLGDGYTCPQHCPTNS